MTVFIPRSQCSVRFLSLPSVRPDEIKSMLAFEVANMFPLKPEELVWDFVIVDKLANGYSRVMLAACQKEVVSALLAKVAAQPGRKSHSVAFPEIGLSTLALFNQISRKVEEAGAQLCVHIENEQAEIIGIRGRRLVFSRGLSLTGAGPDVVGREAAYSLKLMREEGAVEKVLVSPDKDLPQFFIDEIRKQTGAVVEPLKDVSLAGGLKYETAKDSLHIDLLPEEIRLQRLRSRRMRTALYFGGLVLLNLSLIGNLAFMQMKAKVQYLSILKTQTSDISPKANALQKKMLKAQVLNRYVTSGKMTLRILTDLYKLAPSGVLLNSLDIAEGQPAGAVVIVGQANDSESVLRYADALKNANLMRKTEVTYVTKRASSALQLFDFEIRATY